MKQITCCGLVLCLLLAFCHSLTGQATFQKTFGGNMDEEAAWVANTSTGYIVAGYTTSPQSGRDGYLLNLDFNGNMIWQKRYVGGNGHDAFNVVFEKDGNFMVLGETENSGNGGTDVWLLKIGPGGNIIWSKTIGSPDFQEAGNTMIPVSGDRILVGSNKAPTGTTGNNSCFYLLDNNGEPIWSRFFESGPVGNLIRANYVDNGVIYASGGAELDAAFLKLDLETGNVLGSMRYTGNSTEALYYQQPAPDGNILLCDHTWSASGGNEIMQWVNKVTPDGKTLWSKLYNRPGGNLRGRIESAGDGNFLLTPYDGTFSANADALLAKIDEDGNVMWSRNYGQATAPDWLRKSQLAPDGGFISVGTKQNADGNPDILVIKTDSEGLIEGCCIPKGGIVAQNYEHEDQDLAFTSSPWLEPAPVVNQQVNTGLQERAFCANMPLEFNDDVPLCPNGVFTLQGVDYYAPDVVIEVLPGLFGCDTIIRHNLILLPEITRSETIVFCPGTAVNLHGQNYFEEDTVVIHINPLNGCDTVLTYYLVYDTVAQNCRTCAGTFLKIVGDAGRDFQGHGVYDAGDGNLYITGTKQDSALLIKMTPSGFILWSRTFDILPGEVDNMTELIIDSEGMLVGCGQSGGVQPVSAGFAFRYDPLNNVMLWTQTITNGSPFVLGIMEKSPGGNFVLNSNPHIPADNVQLTELARTDGAVVQGPMTKILDTGNEDSFNSALISNGKLYAAGRLTHGNQLTDMRHSLTRMDLNTGTSLTTIGHAFLGPPARLYGTDLAISGNDLVSVGYGNEHGGDLNNSKIFMYRGDTQLNSVGGPLRIDLLATTSEAADEILQISDDYIILGHSLFDTPKDLFLLKVKKSGEIDWSKKIDFGDERFLPESAVQSQILAKDGFLYCVATTSDASGEKRMMILKITQDGKMDGDCDYVTNSPATSELIAISTGQALQFDQSAVNDTMVSVNAPVADRKVGAQFFCRSVVEDYVNIALCQGDSITLGGQVYAQSDTVVLTLVNANGCDSILTYFIEMHPRPVRFEPIGFCPGESVVIGGQAYTQPGTVTDTIPAITGCDTVVTYTLTLLPRPVRTETIEFCPGESVVIGGQAYTQPGIVLDTVPAASGCDTIVTYTLQSTLPAPSEVTIQCPVNISLIAEPGTAPLVETYNLPTAQSDCPCPGISLELTAGLSSGSAFPNGITTVCYEAVDGCGHSASCCFTVTIREVQPCDVKTNGCIRYELLDITADQEQNRTYRIRVINNCANKLIYTAIQLPAGVTALAPADLSTFISENALAYEVRNPNFSPFYSIRFKSTADSISGGQSDIFEYTLPAQSAPLFMDITSRLEPQLFYEAHLNTFYCPIGMTANKQRSGLATGEGLSQVRLFPNPTEGVLWIDAGGWENRAIKWRIFNGQGQELLSGSSPDTSFRIALPQHLSDGLFFCELLSTEGDREIRRFILQR